MRPDDRRQDERSGQGEDERGSVAAGPPRQHDEADEHRPAARQHQEPCAGGRAAEGAEERVGRVALIADEARQAVEDPRIVAQAGEADDGVPGDHADQGGHDRRERRTPPPRGDQPEAERPEVELEDDERSDEQAGDQRSGAVAPERRARQHEQRRDRTVDQRRPHDRPREHRAVAAPVAHVEQAKRADDRSGTDHGPEHVRDRVRDQRHGNHRDRGRRGIDERPERVSVRNGGQRRRIRRAAVEHVAPALPERLEVERVVAGRRAGAGR